MRLGLSYVLFALGMAGLAFGAPRPISREEAFAIALGKITPKLESRAKPGEKPNYVVTVAEKELVREVVKETALEIADITGDKSGAVKMAVGAVAELEHVRNPCVLHSPGATPQTTFPVSDPEVSKENERDFKHPDVIGKICQDGDENLKALFSPESVSAVQNEVMNPGTSDRDPITGAEKPKDPNIAQQGPLDPAKPGATPNPSTGSNPGPGPSTAPGGTLNPTPNAQMAGSATPLARPSMGGAPMLGPSIGGSGSQPSFAGSGVHRGVAPSPGRATTSQPRASADENVEAVRQALDWKVANREMEPAVAQKILDRITPTLRSEPDFGTALQKATLELEQPKETPKPIPAEKPAPAVQNIQKQVSPESAKAKAEPIAQETPAKSPAIADGGWMGLQNWTSPLPIPGYQDSTPKNLGDGLASSLAAAIAKKNAQPISNDGSENGGETSTDNASSSGGGSAAPTGVESLQASGLFESSAPTPKSRVEGEKVNLGSFLQRMALAMGVETSSGAWRKPASDSKQAEFERFENSAALALASVAPESFHPHIPQLVNMLFFLVPFTAVLVAFALWHWHRRRRAN